MNYKNDYIWIGTGDSRNPEQMQSNTHMMHTNNVCTWVKYKGVWYQYARCGCITLYSIFLDCKTEEDYDYVIKCLVEENELYQN